jgi:hypothetical protein
MVSKATKEKVPVLPAQLFLRVKDVGVSLSIASINLLSTCTAVPLAKYASEPELRDTLVTLLLPAVNVAVPIVNAIDIPLY